ncbi:hypothetical protein [Nostoc sp. UHCC 0251]|uniref:hypothetical protein n=1 Tax=Nostoc sp. UHCC 0251 TaxID=3110240 RepID=UPI002B20B5A0|nr:hypothetical protein [Nostoc sp. UHCC 0251]MEA5624569.1 hypothetical protein [Nostoc sp. UHCC 0251]
MIQIRSFGARRIAHWCKLNLKACLEKAFTYCLVSRSQSPTGNAILEAPPPLLAAEPPRAAFPAQRLETRFDKAFI